VWGSVYDVELGVRDGLRKLDLPIHWDCLIALSVDDDRWRSDVAREVLTIASALPGSSGRKRSRQVPSAAC